MQWLPNVITLLRIAGAFALLFIEPLSPIFFFVYAACGLSDILDGFLARRLNCAGKAGALLDSIADIVLAAVLAYVLFPLYTWASWMFIWAAGIAAVRIAAFCVGSFRFKTPLFLHTYLDKLTGAVLLLLPVLCALFGVLFAALTALVPATLACVEELFLAAVLPSPRRDIKGLFALKK